MSSCARGLCPLDPCQRAKGPLDTHPGDSLLQIRLEYVPHGDRGINDLVHQLVVIGMVFEIQARDIILYARRFLVIQAIPSERETKLLFYLFLFQEQLIEKGLVLVYV